MSEQDQSFIELSAEQEASLAGGFKMGQGDYVFFQETAIDTFADNQTEIGHPGGLSASSSSRTGYSFRQRTLAILPGFGEGCDHNPFSRIFALLQRFF